MARDVMILMRENPFRGPLKGVALKIETCLGPEIATGVMALKKIETFFSPKMATSEASAIWAQESLKMHFHLSYVVN